MNEPLSSKWAVKHHVLWSAVTLSELQVALVHGNLHPEMFNRWLLDRVSIASALEAACTRINNILAPRSTYPLLAVAMEEACWLKAYASALGFDIASPRRLTSEAAKLVLLFDSVSTWPSETFSFPSAVAATWGFMMASWQACSVAPHKADIGTHSKHLRLRQFLSRKESSHLFVEAQEFLDPYIVFPLGTSVDAEDAEKVFVELLCHLASTLKRAFTCVESETVLHPCRLCGRGGHKPDNCLFKKSE
jgi:hypothetical protein